VFSPRDRLSLRCPRFDEYSGASEPCRIFAPLELSETASGFNNLLYMAVAVGGALIENRRGMHVCSSEEPEAHFIPSCKIS